MSIQKTIFKLYLFLLPFMALPGVSHLRKAIAPNSPISNNLILLLLGLFLFALFQRGRFPFPKKALVIEGVYLCYLLNIICFITSLVLFIPFGTLNGENTLRASFPSIIFMFLTAATFYYNAMMFQRITKEEIERIFDWLVLIVLGVGFFQLAVLKIPGVATLYDLINFSGILVDSSFLQRMGRICFTGSEPSSAGDIVTVFLLPYIYSKILTTRALKYKLYAMMFIALLCFTFSSTVYIGVAVGLVTFGYFYAKHATNQRILQLLTCCSFAGLILLFCGPYLWQHTSVGNKIEELVFKKTTSQENLSTLTRYSSIRADWQAFLHYPLTGVGNGNQGYFYNSAVEQALSAQALQYGELSDRLEGNVGIVNGGAFIPAFISGYGIIGVILLILFAKQCVGYIRKHPEEYGSFRYMYYIGGITFGGLATAATGLDGNFITLFIVSIPFMQPLFKEKHK